MNAKEFVERVSDVAQSYKTAYIWGGLGSPITETTIKRAEAQYPKNTASGYAATARKLAGDPRAFYFDCVGLIKAILWGWNGDASKSYGGAVYTSNGVPDIGADTMIKACEEVSTDFSAIVPGAVVWLSGHIGVYIGGGLAVECTPKWSGGVQITAVSNIGTRAGYNARKWTKWGKLPYVSYEEEIDMEDLRAVVREVVEEVLDERNPVYKDVSDVPEYWRQTAEAMLAAGAINGGTPAEVCATDVNIRKETLKAAVVAVMYHDAREKAGQEQA